VRCRIFIGQSRDWKVKKQIYIFIERDVDLLFLRLEYFKSLSGALEVKARTATFNAKITYAAEAQSMLRQLLTEVGFI